MAAKTTSPISGLQLDKSALKSGQDTERYQPGRIEKAVLAHVMAEYETNLGVSSPMRNDVWEIRSRQCGTYLRNPDDDHPYALVYEPLISLRLEAKLELNMQQLVPDEQRLDFFELENLKPFPDQLMAQVAQTMGIPQPEAPKFVNRVVTAALRQELRRGGMLQALRKALLQHDAIGWSLSFVDVVTSPKLEPAEEFYAGDLEHMSFGPDGNVVYHGDDVVCLKDEETNEDRYFVVVPRYERMRFTTINPANLIVPDLEQDGGIAALPYFNLYVTQSFRSIMESAHVRRDNKVIGGIYANTRFVRPIDGAPRPTMLDDIDSEYVYADDYSERQKGPGVGTIVTPMRIGRFYFEDVDELRDNPPTGEEMKAFRRKFAFSPEDAVEAKAWIVEWVHEGGTPVLLRFSPWPLPTVGDTQSVAIETRKFPVPGATFAQGVYARGGADLETQANDCKQSLRHAIDQASRPMYWVKFGTIDRRQREMMGERLTFQPGFVFKITRDAQNGAPFGPIVPDQIPVQDITASLNSIINDIDTLVGFSPRMVAGTDSRSATAVITQKSYSERLMLGDVRAVEQILRQWLTHALAVLVDVVQKSGPQGFKFSIPASDLEMFGSMVTAPDVATAIGGGNGYGDGREFTITPEMIASGYAVNILTSGAMGDRESKLQRIERMNQMLMNTSGLLVQMGWVPNIPELLSKYADALGLSPNDVFTPAKAQPAAAGFVEQQAMAEAGGGNPGAAGTKRPDYERQQAEVSAPGEPFPGQERDADYMASLMEGMS